MSIITHSVDIKCHIAIASTRYCKTGYLRPKPDFRFWDSHAATVGCSSWCKDLMKIRSTILWQFMNPGNVTRQAHSGTVPTEPGVRDGWHPYTPALVLM